MIVAGSYQFRTNNLSAISKSNIYCKYDTKLLLLPTLGIFLVLFSQSSYADTDCADKLAEEAQKIGSTIDNDKARLLAESTGDYKHNSQTYKINFDSVFLDWSFDPQTCENLKLKSINAVFFLYDQNGYVKNFVVSLDPQLTTVLQSNEYESSFYSGQNQSDPSDSISDLEDAKDNIDPIDIGIEVPDFVVVKKGDSIEIPITVTIPRWEDSNVKMAIVADGQEEAFYTTGQAILPEGFSSLRTGSMSWSGASDRPVHVRIFFELTPSWDVSPGNYTLAAASSNQNSAASKYFKVNVLDNLNVGFPKTNVTEIYHLKGNYYSPERKLEYHNFKIPYKISNGTIEGINVDQLSESSVVDIKSVDDGLLEIDVPRNLFDQQYNRLGDLVDDPFIVIIDSGSEVNYTEIKTPCFRSLSINFPEKSEKIAIVGFNILTGPEPFASNVPPIFLVTNGKNYTRGDTITIFGCTSLDINEKEMVFNIIDPQGKNVKSQTIKPNLDGTFLYQLDTKNEFLVDGNYTIKTSYGNYTNTRTVTVPEFPLAGLILVASMVTILIIARKWAQNNPMMVA